jgi:para-aminobenzoate synthetase component I
VPRPPATAPAPPWAWFDGQLVTDLLEVVDLIDDPGALDRDGWWAVRATFEGHVRCYRFDRVQPAPELPAAGGWTPIPAALWMSDLDQDDYLVRLAAIKRAIEAGDVYQVNLCRRMSAPLPAGADPGALAALLAAGNPAPYAGVLCADGEWLVTASPELFLSRDGDLVESAPIKGTAAAGEPFATKDAAENVMITDLVRNDLNRICRPDSVRVRDLLATEHHPGLSHLVSTVAGRLRPGVGWTEILAATFPPGSVTGAPKIRALELIRQLEQTPRDVYCGAVGFVDATRRRAKLAVGIRTFFTTDGASRLHFGTGAGITYPSDPAAEWAETELKAARLVGLATMGQ